LLNGCLIDLSESDSEVNSSVEEADTVNVQATSVDLNKEQIALYRGSREYQAITVEHYCIGIHQLASPISLHTHCISVMQ